MHFSLFNTFFEDDTKDFDEFVDSAASILVLERHIDFEEARKQVLKALEETIIEEEGLQLPT